MPTPWWAKGLLFENCNCQSICPGHVHFDQLCTHDRCIGYWAVRVDEGAFGDVDLAGAKAIIAYDSPKHMIDGGWTQSLVIDDAAAEPQRGAIEAILTGTAGGPWSKLAPFVGTALPTEYRAVTIVDEGKRKTASVPGRLEGRVEAIRSRDRTGVVTFENMFNQIHPPSQVIARGTSTYDDGTVAVTTENTHGLYSQFAWAVTDA